MRVIQATPKAKTNILFQNRKTPNDAKGRAFSEGQADSEDYEEKGDKSDGLLNLGYSDDETQ